jgi:TonB family protein
VTPSPQKTLQAQVRETEKKVSGFEKELHAVEDALREMSEQGQQLLLLGQACEALDKLEAMGASALFWGKKPEVADVPEHMRRVRALATAHQEKLSAAESRRKALQDKIQNETLKVHLLSDEIAELEDEEELAKTEYPISREITAIPYRPVVMPWSHRGEDQRRFRRSLLLALLMTLLFSGFVEMWVLPVRDLNEVVEIPERMVRLAQKTPPPPPQELKKTEKQEDKAKPTEAQQARAKAETSGVLAFKNAFKDLMNDVPDNLGTGARVSNSGRQTTGHTQRSLVTAQAREGSGGIGSASLSRNVAGTGTRLGGVGFSRVQSDVGTAAGADRALSSGAGPSRTDEEIQIVFDRYKAALYRIYNRELRSNPGLRGKMILRITIDPNGEVSACRIESTDLASSALGTEVVERVKKFNFGPKDGVPKITILYPIDFLPASS